MSRRPESETEWVEVRRAAIGYTAVVVRPLMSHFTETLARAWRLTERGALLAASRKLAANEAADARAQAREDATRIYPVQRGASRYDPSQGRVRHDDAVKG